MKQFPVFVSVEGRRIVVSGGGETALAKLRLLIKSSAQVDVYASDPIQGVVDLASSGQIDLHHRSFRAGDAAGAVLFYAANDDAIDFEYAAWARADGALANVVDNPDQSDFFTPAIVDRDPVTVAIGTEGTAPILARQIKAMIEERLAPNLGLLAKIAGQFRSFAEILPKGAARRAFWADYFQKTGPRAIDQGEEVIRAALDDLLIEHQGIAPRKGHVAFVGAGPGDPDLLTLKARKELDRADVVIYDRLVGRGILELARREAIMIDVGKTGFGPSATQSDINALIVEHVSAGAYVVRLKGGDATVFGRLDEEIDAIAPTGASWHIVPGITSASAAVAALGQSLTKRGRNTSVQFLTGHDVVGFADHDWRGLAREGAVAAIYMGKKSARFIQGRLLMHGGTPKTTISIVENASRPDQRILSTTLAEFASVFHDHDIAGPALIFLGLAPRQIDLSDVTPFLQEMA